MSELDVLRVRSLSRQSMGSDLGSYTRVSLETRVLALESQQAAILARLGNVEPQKRLGSVCRRRSSLASAVEPETKEQYHFLPFRVLLFIVAIACIIPFPVANITKLPSAMQIALVSYPISLTCTLMLVFLSLEGTGSPRLAAFSWTIHALVLIHDAFVCHPFGSEGNVLDALTAIIQGLWTAFQFHVLMCTRTKLILFFRDSLHDRAVALFKRALVIGFAQFVIVAPVLVCENSKLPKAPRGISIDDFWLSNTCMVKYMPDFFLAQAGSQTFVFIVLMLDIEGLSASRLLKLEIGGWACACAFAFGCYLCSVLFLYMAGHHAMHATLPYTKEVLQCAMYFQGLFWVCGHCASQNVADMIVDMDEEFIEKPVGRVSL